jgi:hypothetical protein
MSKKPSLSSETPSKLEQKGGHLNNHRTRDALSDIPICTKKAVCRQNQNHKEQKIKSRELE